jgi:hypothetical protein
VYDFLKLKKKKKKRISFKISVFPSCWKPVKRQLGDPGKRKRGMMKQSKSKAT